MVKKSLPQKNAIFLVLPIEEISLRPELSSPARFRFQEGSPERDIQTNERTNEQRKSSFLIQDVNPPTILDNKALCRQLRVVQHHQQYPSRSALTNPTPPPMSQPQRTHQSYTTTDVLAAAHSPIIHHHRCFCSNLFNNVLPLPSCNAILIHNQCPSRSALTNPTPPPMLLF